MRHTVGLLSKLTCLRFILFSSQLKESFWDNRFISMERFLTMNKDVIALTNLQETFHRLFDDEIPSFIDMLNTTLNLPPELRNTLKIVEKNVEKSRTLLAPLLNESLLKDVVVGATTGTGAFGGGVGGIFSKLSKKQDMNKFSGKKMVNIQDSASLFEDTIQRMEQLLEKTQQDDSSQRNYAQLTSSEKKELLNLSEQMKNLSEELSEELAV